MYYCGICYSVHFPGACRSAEPKYAAQVYAPIVSLDAFQAEPDPAEIKLCRPCSASDRVEGFIHACAGNGCECPLCKDILPLLKELDDEWDLIERWSL